MGFLKPMPIAILGKDHHLQTWLPILGIFRPFLCGLCTNMTMQYPEDYFLK